MKYEIERQENSNTKDEDYQVQIPIIITEGDEKTLEDHINSTISSTPSTMLSTNQLLSLRYVVMTSHSLKDTLATRISLVVLRLRLLYILMHCQTLHPSSSEKTITKLLENYLTPIESSSKLLIDLITLADTSSSIWFELNLTQFPYPLASLSIDCLLGIFETNQKRMKIPSTITMLHELGVYSSSDRSNNENRNKYLI